MESAQQRNKIFVVILLSIFVISSVNAAVSGFSKVEIQSNYAGLDCPDGCWVFYWTDTGMTTDSVTAFFSESTLKSETGAETSQSLDINIKGTSNECRYDIIVDGDRLDIITVSLIDSRWTYDYPAWQYTDEEAKALALQKLLEKAKELDCYKDNNYPNGFPGYMETKITGLLNKKMDFTLICYKEASTLASNIGTLRNLKYVTSTKWEVQAEGETLYSDIVSNSETGSGKSTKLGEDVYVQWLGLLSSGETCPISTEELMAYGSNFNGNWRVINRQNYISYETYMSSSLDDIAKSYFTGGYTKTQVENLVNNKASSAILEKTFSGFNVNIIDSSVSNGKLKIILDRIIKFPQFRLIVDSDYLRLNIPTGEPQITCPTSVVKFNEGQLANLQVTAKNVGDAEGGFVARVLSCSGQFSAGDQENLRLNKGQSQSVTLSTTAKTTNNNVEKGYCTIELKETITQETDTCIINLEASPPPQCTEGKLQCGYDENLKSAIMICSSGKFVVKEKCDKECAYDITGKPYCTKDNSNNCTWYQEPYTKDTEDWGVLGWRHIINKPIISTVTGCRTSWWVYAAIAGFTIAIIVIAKMIINRKTKFTKKK
jgi:hypothetical protein